MPKIININDVLYEPVGKMTVIFSDKKGTEYWKKQYNADIVLRNGNLYYYCRTIIDAEFEEI